MASSSTSINKYTLGPKINKYTHDIFLSFRGADTRYTFTGHLHRALLDKGIYVFIDNELERGEEITLQLLKVIEESRISIVVLSKHYASSSFCLDELVKILECKEFERQIVIPVFYHVDPTDVEEQTGAFGQEFAKLEARWNLIPAMAVRIFRWMRYTLPAIGGLVEEQNEGALTDIDKAQNWRFALTKVARLSGYHLKEGDHEANAIQNIVKEVSTRLHHVTTLHVGEHLIGLDYHVEFIHQKFKIKLDDTFMLGLYGMGGIGKTTLAKALYNKWAKQFQYDGCCFLETVRENANKHGLVELQEKLLREILRDQNLHLGNSDKGIEVIKYRLRCKRVLILIDDVDNIEQLQKLAGELEWFGAGSRIIITTRNSRLLEEHGHVTIKYEVKKLKDDLAIELFSSYAFREPEPREAYLELTNRAIRYAQGLPLALKVLGSSLYKRSEGWWHDTLKKLEQCGEEKIFNVLKVSYDDLDREEKIMFLDIAFFFKGKIKDTIIKFFDGCGFYGLVGIEKLIEKSLLYDDVRVVRMHDLLQEMGTRIALENFSRLCIRKGEDILSMSLGDKRANDVEILVLDLHGEEEVPLKWLQSLSNLRVLAIRNGRFIKMPKKLPNSIRWLECRNNSLTSIPSKFLPHNLFALEMHCRSMKAFVIDMPKAQKFKNLSRLNLSKCLHLREIVIDFSSIPNIEVLDLTKCKKLKKIHKSVGSLEKLENLQLEGCYSLTGLPNLDKNKCLEIIDLTNCSNFENLPNLPITITQLHLNSSGIKEIPLFIGNLINLNYINASDCKNLLSVSNSIYMLSNVSIALGNCPKLTQLPEFQSSMVSLGPFFMHSTLILLENKYVSLPKNTFKFTHIVALFLSNCEWLVEIPELPHTLQTLGAKKCKSLVRFSQFQFVRNFEGDFSNCHNILGESEKKRWKEMIEEEWRIERNEVPLLKSYKIIVPGNEISEGFSYNFNCDDPDCHSFHLPSSLFNPNLIAITSYAIFRPTSALYSIIKFSMNEFTIYSTTVYSPIESEHTLLAYRYYDFDLLKLSEAEEISCKFYCKTSFREREEPMVKRVGVHLIYKNKEDEDMEIAPSLFCHCRTS